MRNIESRIKAYIARSIDPASTPAEKNLAQEKAKQLILESGVIPNLEEEILISEYPYKAARIESWRFHLWHHLCRIMGALGAKVPGRGLKLYCYPSQRDAILTTFEYCCEVIEKEGKNYYGLGRAYVNSYKLGMAEGIVGKMHNRLPEDLQVKAMVFLGTYEKINAQVDTVLKSANYSVAKAHLQGFKDGLNSDDPRVFNESQKQTSTKFLAGVDN
jgi:hypothetical protein